MPEPGRKDTSIPADPTPKKVPEVVAKKTAARKARMLTAMLDEDVFTVRTACKRADIDPTTHYDWLKVDKVYAMRIDEAIEQQVQRLEQSAHERAVGIGVKAPSDLLTMFLLNAKRPAVYRPAVKGSFEGKNGEVVTFSLSLGDAGGAS